MKKIKTVALLLGMMMLFGCGGTDQEIKDKEEKLKPTQEVTAEPTGEPEETDKNDGKDGKTDKPEKEITIPHPEQQVARYTSVEHLYMKEGSRIAVVVKDMDSAYWKAVKQGVDQAIDDLNAALGYEGDDKIVCTFEGPKNGSDVNEQVNILDAVIAENPDFLCLAAIDMSSCEAQLEAAAEDKIPVIILDSGVENNNLVRVVCATNNLAAGEEAAKRLCERIEEEGQVAVLGHMQMSETSKERVRGFKKEITENHPNVEIVNISYEPSKEGDTSIEELIKAVLVLYPEVKGYFCTNETVSITALKVLSDYQERGIQLVGFDLGKEQAEAIRNGVQAGVVSQNPYGMGYATIVAGVRETLGLPNNLFIDAGFQWLDQTNIDLEENEKYLYE